MKPRLLYIGSAPYDNMYVGAKELHRHFIERKDFDFHAIVEPDRSAIHYLLTNSSTWNRLVKRASNTRLFPQFVALNYMVCARRQMKAITKQAKQFQPQAIVTVAYGGYSFLAAKVAQQLRLPLFTFFHDWWPDLTPCRGIGKRILDLQFRNLQRKSTVSLCVCDAMKAELGSHENTRLLYPIPAVRDSQTPTAALPAQHPFRLVYLGTLQGKYGDLLQTLAAHFIQNPNNALELKFYGRATDWPAPKLLAAQSAGIYQGTPTVREAAIALAEADAFLVVMNFDEADRRRVRTSFPSKILEYCSYAKPIVAWGPEDCSAVSFVRSYRIGSAITQTTPTDVVKATNELATNPARCLELGRSALGLSQTIFAPEEIHGQLLRYISPLLKSR